MLRNSKHILPGSLSFAARVLTVASLAALGLLVAGLRGPAGESTVLAQGQPIAQPGGGGAQDAANAYNLAFLPADTKLVLALQPGSLLRRRDIHSIVNSIVQGSQLRKVFVVPPEDIEQFVLFWEDGPRRAGGPPLAQDASGVVLRTSKAQDWKARINEVFGPSREVRHAGQTYFRCDHQPLTGAVFAPDNRTLVRTQDEELLRELIEDRNVPTPRRAWDDAWKKVPRGQVMLALDARWLRRQIASLEQGGRLAGPTPQEALVLKFQTFSPLWEKTRSYAMGINATDRGLAVDLVAGTGSDQDAKPVAETIQAMVTLAKNALQGFRQNLHQPVEGGEGMEWLLRSASSLLDKARVETSEGFVHFSASSDADLAEGIKLLAPAVTTARASARRAQSANNLKQIGLAFHNYNSVHNHFPSSVNFGGKTGKVPYSWRVAILPFIEQQALYNAYNFDEPWDGPNNRKLIEKLPPIYDYPGVEGTRSNSVHSSYFVFTGESTVLSVSPRQGPAGRRRTLPLPGANEPATGGPTVTQITDGAANTILAVEAKRDIPWTKPEDIPFDSKAPLPELGGFWENGFNALFADGSVRTLKKSIQSPVLKALITRDGGEVLSSDSY